MITERTLRKWRRAALKTVSGGPRMKIVGEIPPGDFKAMTVDDVESAQRILRLTQELLDQHLLRKEVR